MKRISIIIVNWNGKSDTIACLDSLKKIHSSGVQLEIIVVDNGSTDDSVTVIKGKYPRISLVATGNNSGFTGGNNAGIRLALTHGAEYVWLLNNDTIVHPDALRLVDVFDDRRVGVAGSKIYFADGHEFHRNRYAKSERGRVIWYAGGLLDWDNMYASHRGVDEVDHGQFDTPQQTPFVTGCSFMASRAVFDRIGLLDERFFLYLEDLDFCLRARNAGFQIMYNPTSVVWHKNAGASGGAGSVLHEYYMTRNRLYIGMRYAPVRTKLSLIRESAMFALTGSLEKRRAVLDALTGKWGGQYDSKKTNA